jgi:beta-glucanase (GH16 family)
MNNPRSLPYTVRTVLVAGISVLIASCGGGSSGSTDSTLDGSNQSLTTIPSSATTGSTPTTSTPTTSTPTTSTPTTSTPTTSTPTTSTPTTVAGPTGQDASLYTLAFDEEFDSYNANLWNDHIWYESSNATKNYTVENGVLKIWPQKDASGNFFNRAIDTDGKYYQTYGYFEMEAKLPVGKGTWPAFWLYNHDQAAHPEIDIMEAYAGGGPNSGWSDSNLHPTAYGATAWPNGGDAASIFQMVATPDLSAGFHKYGMKWEPNKLTFYFDGKLVHTANATMPKRMYILLDLWYGSASGQADNTTPTGKTNSYEVNYVRAWQFK